MTATRLVPPAGPAPAVPGSFRDPRSRVYDLDGRIVRGLDVAGAADFAAVERTAFYRDVQGDGSLVATRRVDLADHPEVAAHGWSALLGHDRIPVVTHPYEWSFSMLRDAALLQLAMVRRGLVDGVSCKDGTAYNVQFVGARATFVDVGSFRPVRGDAWPGYRQFCATFLYPLMVEAYLGISFAPLLRGSLEGIEPDVAARLLRGRARFRRGVLTHVTVQALAARRFARQPDPTADLVRGDQTNIDIVDALARRTGELVGSLPVPAAASEWSGYAARGHYVADSLAGKDRFVLEVLDAVRPSVVVDLGCNDGRYAEMAASVADTVVAVDADRRVVDELYSRLRRRTLPIVPMVADLADPSPALGWNLAERTSLAERVDPDLVFSLALIHHLVLGRNIPIGDYLDALAALAPHVVLEVPHRDDPMVRKLLAAKPADVHTDYELAHIDALVQARFEVVRQVELPGGTRTIYDLVSRSR